MVSYCPCELCFQKHYAADEWKALEDNVRSLLSKVEKGKPDKDGIARCRSDIEQFFQRTTFFGAYPTCNNDYGRYMDRLNLSLLSGASQPLVHD